jgi:ubiquinone/menaquinone biosynthesis C-methylase UbiE
LWRRFTGPRLVGWALQGHDLVGDVLELGGGSGQGAAHLARSYPQIRLVVTDVDPAMVARADRELVGLPNVRAQVADVTALPFADASFDAATASADDEESLL